ncbi:flavin reductase like domain-containing protein [Kockiozyma suomiensis]|uniref:flavin reductase like domain-containing protein n=1 Tax=Kockiozyma suomiensis TaxID=1337062 RepID=UPI003344196C
MARHAAPLAVITASHEGDRRAATVSSVTSLSVSPEGAPLITFNLKLPSKTSQLIHDSGRFSVNFLSGAHAAEHVARGFAGSIQSTKAIDFVEDDVEIIGVDWFPLSDAPYDTPILNRTRIKSEEVLASDGIEAAVAFARVDCITKHCFTVSDHEIWVGEVERLEIEDERSASSSTALVYFNRQFVRVSVKDAREGGNKIIKRMHLKHE